MRKIALTILLSGLILSTFACDICGCGAGGYYFGLMPQFNRNFIGLRYRYIYFDTYGHRAWENTQEHFNITEIWARYYVHKKWQIVGFMPYSFNEQRGSSSSKYLQGINDMMFLGNYNLISTIGDTSRRMKHSLWIGAGIKLPTGRYKYNENITTQVANPNFQLGTGSIDLILSATHTLRLKKGGINAELSYKINTTNSQSYKFGNKLLGSVSAFYIHTIKNVGLMPHIGSYFEATQLDQKNNSNIEHTGGNLFASSLGADLYYKNYTFALHWQQPLLQNLAQGHIQAQSRVTAHVSFLF